MEAIVATKPKTMNVLDELMNRETIIHWPEVGTSRRDIEKMMESEFWEVGASGRSYTREEVLDVLEERSKTHSEEIFETKDPHCQEIAPDNYLLTYTLVQKDRVTRRATIWRRTAEGWKIVYHQGTIVVDR